MRRLAGAGLMVYDDGMTKLEAVIERLKALPQQEQEAFAADIEAMLAQPESRLTREQWVEVDVELAGDSREDISHADVVAAARARLAG